MIIGECLVDPDRQSLMTCSDTWHRYQSLLVHSTIARPGCSLADAADIGGATLLRAAAKNHKRISVALRTRQLCQGMEGGKRRGLAFDMTAKYDVAIGSTLILWAETSSLSGPPQRLALRGGANKHPLKARTGLRHCHKPDLYNAGPEVHSIEQLGVCLPRLNDQTGRRATVAHPLHAARGLQSRQLVAAPPL